MQDIKDKESSLSVTLQEKDPDNLIQTLSDIQNQIKELESQKAEIEV